MSDVKAELMEIDGVGEVTAEKILEVVEDSGGDEYEAACRDALDKLEEGHASHAEGHLRNAL